MAYAEEDFSSTDDSVVDHIIRHCPASVLDCRSYYWRNFKYPGTSITYHHHHFQHTLSIGSIYPQSPGGAYVCTFNESMLLTWVGVECLVQHRLATAYSISVNVIDGSNPFENSRTTVFTYSKVPLPISRYEPQYLHEVITSDRIDTGTNTHTRVHNEYSVEIVPWFDELRSSMLANAKVVLKVQHPARVGGTQDHPSWDRGSYSHSHGRKDITSYRSFKKYILKGDDTLYY